jgi:hypothetical protein
MQDVSYLKTKTNFARAIDSLKRAWEENPVAVMSAAGILLTGAAKVLTGVSSFRNTRSWQKEVKRREAKDRSRRV